jgi:hypothetical protein
MWAKVRASLLLAQSEAVVRQPSVLLENLFTCGGKNMGEGFRIRSPGFAGEKIRLPFPKTARVNSIVRWQPTATGNPPAATLVAHFNFPLSTFPRAPIPFPNHPAMAR